MKRSKAKAATDEVPVSIGKAADILGVHRDTLRGWEREGKLVPVRTLGGHRRYYPSQIRMLMHEAHGASTFKTGKE